MASGSGSAAGFGGVGAAATAGTAGPAGFPGGLLWWSDWAEGGLLCAGALMAWALALYVATRGGLRRVPILTAAALALLSVYLVGLGLATLTPEHPDWIWWLQRTWWTAALVPAVWLLVALALVSEEGPQQGLLSSRVAAWALPWIAPALLATGALFAILGSLTALVNDWSASLEVANVAPGGPPLRRITPEGPLFTAYEAYLLLCAAAACAVFLRLWLTAARGTSLRARFGWLVAAAVLFLLAGAQLTAVGAWFSYAVLPGHLMLVAGIAIMGWNVARYGALLAGEVVTQDFWAFAASITALMMLYGAVFVAIGSTEYAWLRRSVPVLLLLATTHVLADTRSPLLDRVLYGPVSGGLRWQLRALAARVVRQPDLMTALAEVRETVDTLLRAIRTPAALPPPVSAGQEPSESPRAAVAAGAPRTAGGVGAGSSDSPGSDSSLGSSGSLGAASLPTSPTSSISPAPPASRASRPAASEPLADFRLLVEGALRHLNDLPTLSRHDLLDRLPTTASGSALERAAQLRAELDGAIDRLAPPGPRPSPGAQAGMGGWLHYLVLHEAYVEGRPNKQVMQRYHLSEGTFHRARRRALDAITLDLHERWTS